MTIMHRMFRGLTGAVSGVALVVAICAGRPRRATIPDRPIRMIVPFAPGGATDFLARIVQPKMQELLGQPVVVENRAGAAGNVGMELAARSAPDGYVIFMGDVGTISINAAIFKDMKVVPTRDFTPVSIIADTPSLLVTSSEFPAEHRYGAGQLSQGPARPCELRIAGQRQPEPAGHGALRREGGREDQPRAVQGRLGSGRDRRHGRACPFHVRDHRVDPAACSLQSHEGRSA